MINRRLLRVLKNKKVFLAALDHGIYMGYTRGLEDPVKTAELLAPFVDGFIVNRGIIDDILSIARDHIIVYKINGITKFYNNPYDLRVIGSIEDALSFDADAISYEMYIGGPQEPRQLEEASLLIRESRRFNIPIILHVYPHGEDRSPDKISHCIRLGWELGADIIKTFYFPGMGSLIKSIINKNRYVIVAGGPKLEKINDVKAFVINALAEGVSGFALGRNLWGWSEDEVKDLASYIRNILNNYKNN